MRDSIKCSKTYQKYDSKIPFLLWVRRVIINCGIDNYRKSKKYQEKVFVADNHLTNDGMSQLESEYLLKMVRSLSPQYKIVFVLHTIDGYSHEEISKKLNISKGTSKSNLSKAKKKLQEMLKQFNKNTAYVRE